jgi:hypothetical protein
MEPRGAGVVTYRPKPARRQLSLPPIRPPPAPDRHRLVGLHIRDYFVDLGAVERALDTQHVGHEPSNPSKLMSGLRLTRLRVLRSSEMTRWAITGRG